MSAHGTQPEYPGLKTRTGRLNREHLDECLNGDCSSLRARQLAMAVAPENQTKQRSLHSSRRESRPVLGTRESHAQGEGKQVFQL